MTYKQAMFFIGKCLNAEENYKKLLQKEINSINFNWDTIVQVSTKHYVLPALYNNLKRKNLLSELPFQLAQYMDSITALNKSRNTQLIKQANEINSALLEQDISPIFLKGTAFLIENLYDDISERMVGDIDFLVSTKELHNTIQILKSIGYSNISNKIYYQKNQRHYPRLIHKDKIGAVEVHTELTLKKYRSYFNYKLVSENVLCINHFRLMSYKNQVIHTIINNQINDNAKTYKQITLRNCYDLLLLSRKENTLLCAFKIPKIFHCCNNYIAISSLIFRCTTTLIFVENYYTRKFKKTILQKLNNPVFAKMHTNCITFYMLTTSRINILIKALYGRPHFLFVLSKISDVNWYKRLLLGTKRKLN